MDDKLCVLLFPFECLFQHHMWRGWGYVILVIVLAVVFNLNTFFEFTYGTYSEIYCAEASGCEGWGDKSQHQILIFAPPERPVLGGWMVSFFLISRL